MSTPAALAADFPKASLEQWRGLVEKALKGGDFDKRLVARTADGVRIPPLYTKADTVADASDFTRGSHKSVAGYGWDIMTLIDGGDAATANRALLADLEGGANGVVVQVAAPGQSGVTLTSASDAATLLTGVYLDLATLEVSAGLAAAQAAAHIMAALPALPGQAGQRKVAFNLDPLGTLARLGTTARPITDELAATIALARTIRATEPHARTVLVDAIIGHEAGGSEGQELALLAATLVAYLRAFEAGGVGPADALAQINVHISADTDIFLTAAKLRAARQLIARIADACGVPDAAPHVRLTAITSARMMARRDPWTNMLRTTAATAAAAFGGADAIVALPFTHALGASDAFGRRIARNAQIVAQEESHLGRVVDPAGGSWYIEKVTGELAAKGWSIFQEIEAEGGLVAALTSGLIQDQIAAVASQRAKAIATGRFELTGVSAFPLPGPDGVTVIPRAAAAPLATKPVVRPLTALRLAAPFEALRDAADAAPTKPVVFMAALGTIADHTARSSWARNFLASGGIEAAATQGYPTPEAAADAFKASGAHVAMIASSDAIYAAHGEATARALKAAGATHIVLAGRPGEREAALTASGVDRFIFTGQDGLATLAGLQGACGGAGS